MTDDIKTVALKKWLHLVCQRNGFETFAIKPVNVNILSNERYFGFDLCDERHPYVWDVGVIRNKNGLKKFTKVLHDSCIGKAALQWIDNGGSLDDIDYESLKWLCSWLFVCRDLDVYNALHILHPSGNAFRLKIDEANFEEAVIAGELLV